MRLKITCPKCGNVHLLQDVVSVEEIECRGCNHSIKLPLSANNKQLGEKGKSHTPQLPRNQKSPSQIPWILGSIGTVVLVSVLGCCGGLALISRNNNYQNGDEAFEKPIPWGQTATFGNLKVGLKSASIAPYSGTSKGGTHYNSSETALVVVVTIVTADKTKKHSAKGAIGSADLEDDFGNMLNKQRMADEFGWTIKIDGQLEAGATYSVRSDDPLNDTLVFEKPVEAASTLKLRLDAENYGGRGKVVFEIPASVWKFKRP